MSELAGDSERLKRADAESYDATASDFDTLTDRYSTAIASRMLAIGEVGRSDSVLDLGTGTGLVARLAADRGANVIGIDHSEGMLGRARLKAEQAGVASRASFQPMDAEALTFEDGTFDVITSLYVLRHLPNPRAAVGEMHRTLRPGGRLVVAVGARPSPFSASAVASGLGAMTDRFLASIGRRALSPSFLRGILDRERVPPNASHAAHHENEDVSGLLSGAGFQDIRREWWGERYHLSPEEFWDVQAVFDSEARERLTRCSGDQVEKLRRRFLDECNALSKKGVTFVYRTGAIIYSAQR
jgi:ubiquinone/menaquinone biosynthesis C-methylase UbiE